MVHRFVLHSRLLGLAPTCNNAEVGSHYYCVLLCNFIFEDVYWRRAFPFGKSCNPEQILQDCQVFLINASIKLIEGSHFIFICNVVLILVLIFDESKIGIRIFRFSPYYVYVGDPQQSGEIAFYCVRIFDVALNAEQSRANYNACLSPLLSL